MQVWHPERGTIRPDSRADEEGGTRASQHPESKSVVYSYQGEAGDFLKRCPPRTLLFLDVSQKAEAVKAQEKGSYRGWTLVVLG